MTFRFGFGWSLGLLGACSLYLGAGCGAVTSRSTPDERGPEQEPPPGVEPASATFGASGKRLAVMAYESDGAVAVSHILDEALGTECEFKTDERGVARCFPTTQARVVYLDETCQSPAIYLLHGAERDWVVERDAQPQISCPGELPSAGALFRVGERVYDNSLGSNITIYESQAGQCRPTWPEAKDDPPVHRLAPHAADELVAGTIVGSTATDGYRVTRMVAEDGAVLNLGVRLDDGTPCALQRDGVCVPQPFATISSWLALDSSCGEPALASASLSACGAPRYGLLSPEGKPTRLAELTPARAVFSMTPVLPPPPDAHELEYTCEASSSTEFAFALLAEVAVPRPVAKYRMLGDGALQAPAFQLTADAASYLLPATTSGSGPGFTDGGEPCAVSSMADGTLRCLRGNDEVLETGYFVDGYCRQRAYVRQDSKLQPLDDALIARSFVMSWGAGGRIDSLSAVKRHNAGVFELVDQECQPAEARASREVFGADLSAALLIDAPIALDTLPLVKLERL
jgi:hypothetical protein